MLRILLMCSLLAAAEPRQVTVYREQGRFGGWPANHGIWSWGNEILVGFSAAWFQKTAEDRHAMDRTKPEEPRLARSLDGGETWTVETPPSLLPPEQGGKQPVPLLKPMDFTAPNFAMTLRLTKVNTGPSLLYYSNDRGKSWLGPYQFPLFGQKGIAARTDYIVNGKRDCHVFLTASKSNGREGRPLVVRTQDGGLTWKFVSWIGPEPAGFAIMPSSVRLDKNTLLTAVRHKEDPVNTIDLYRSKDNGANWTLLCKPANTGKSSGNPPSLIQLKDGRLALAYGYRDLPYGVRARVSKDRGVTWGDEIVLRNDGAFWDVGYPRSVQRPDGKVVTVYYFADGRDKERFIGATIWEP
jgi:hypothetical protein